MPTETLHDAAEEIAPAEIPGSAADDCERISRAATARAIVFKILPVLAMLLACGTAWLKWWETSSHAEEVARAESVKAATDGTVALLSYQPDTVDSQLVRARDLLTGAFRDSYTSLTTDVVIPGAKQKHISAVATVPAAAVEWTSGNRATVLVMVNQTTAVGTDPPTQTATSIRVTMDRVDGRWLISDFSPI